MSEFIPLFHFAEITASDDRSERAATHENSARPATAQVTFISTGIGQHRLKAPAVFPVVFTRAPILSTGSLVVTNGGLSTWHDPIGSCGVWGWQRDDNGYYTGAYVWLRIDVYPVDELLSDPAPTMVVEHHLTFSGQAIKDLSQYVGKAELSILKTRDVGI